ncbi:MAG: InlB B-repeat-containing protein, partial [Coriobacteriales bacterium]|nr:InlB B-repeat-containing protein [Coriobacteriales bacterium]
MTKQDFAYDARQALVANAFTRKGYSFVGWNTKKDGSGKAYKNKQEVVNLTSKDGSVVTLYAQWKKNAASIPSVKVIAHSQNLGWCDAISIGSVYGTTQKSLRLEAVRISVPNSRYSGGVEYRSHVQNAGLEKTWTR